jgi:hypothetical protein|tara:strand:+ start:147 stop:302 length:156 start_codon:yes stop_codon:yes gene_type:complete
METCYRCGTREIVDSLPEDSGGCYCGGCHKKIYGLWEEDCRQVILRADYEN